MKVTDEGQEMRPPTAAEMGHEPAKQTVREQLVAALEQLVLNINLTTTYGGNLLVLRPASPLAIGEALLANANRALDRARAEPEEK